MSDHFTCDLNSKTESFPHFWEHTIGSGHATLALRADWQQQLKRCHHELGFKYVRFHGILSDNMGTLVDENNELIYSFFNSDQVFDFLLSIGMAPFVELSFMPLALASGNKTVFKYQDNVTPPKDYSAWEVLISKTIQHWVQRYGLDKVRTWFFEVWNEPNLKSFWTATQSDYFILYKHTAKAIKEIDPDLKVGGPATAKNAWITEFKDYCEKHTIPFDFISTHHYPTDAFGKPGDDTIEQLAKSERSILRKEATDTKKKAGETPVYYTEWSTSSNPFDDLHDESYAASFIVKTIMEARGQVEGYSYWTFSDIFDENYFSSRPFHGGFGLMNIYGIPKPAYRAFELLHRLGHHLIKVEGTHSTIDVWLTTKNSIVQVIITNSVLPKHPVMSELVRIKLENMDEVKKVTVQKIDDDHVNVRGRWINMGKPEGLSPAQVTELETVSVLVEEPLRYDFDHKTLSLEVEVPAQCVALITIETI
jgi:xylan 1,4-beta-xylosidase